MNFGSITSFIANRRIVQNTEIELRKAGRDGYELFVLWSGTVQGDRFIAQTMHVPQQRSYKLQEGLCVRVDGAALHGINRWLFDHSEVLAVQIHTHPTVAYHSDTDSTYPIVTTAGGLSIVVPNFCRDGLISTGTVAYRLRAGGWIELDSGAFRRILQVPN